MAETIGIFEELMASFDFSIKKGISLHKEMKGEVEWLQNELRFMQAFLQDAKQKQDGGERLQVWVSDIRDIAYAIDDVLDVFLISRVLKPQIRIFKFGRRLSIFRNSGYSSKVGFLREIKAINRRVLEVSRRGELYGMINYNIGPSFEAGASSGASIPRDLRLTTASYTNEDHAVDFDQGHIESSWIVGVRPTIIVSLTASPRDYYGWEYQPPPSIVSPAATMFGTPASARSSFSSVSSTASPRSTEEEEIQLS